MITVRSDIRIHLADDKALWPDVVKVCHCRAMMENGWDEITAYVQMLIGNVWLPMLDIDDDTPRAVLRLPCQKKWREKNDGRDETKEKKRELNQASKDNQLFGKGVGGVTASNEENHGRDKCPQIHQISFDELLEQI